MSTSVLNFTTSRKEIAIQIDGKNYTLKEMTGTQRDFWMSSMSNRMRLDSGGKPTGIKDFKGLQSSLIVLCLYDNEGKGVIEQAIGEWPASVQKAVYEQCEELNGLNAEAEEKEKNS